jgi:hypothetical protein
MYHSRAGIEVSLRSVVADHKAEKHIVVAVVGRFCLIAILSFPLVQVVQEVDGT